MMYAPVIIPTLCRYEHFKRCIESLSRCTGAEYTEVYIGLDYPAKESHWEGYKKIQDYLNNCGNLGFKKLHVIERPYNYGFGPKGNYRLLREYILSKYDRLISSEDDNEFSPCFLDYMNKGLELYKDDESILSISGYNYPIKMNGYEHNIYFSPKFSAWGCGLWKEKEEKFISFYNENPPRKILLSKGLKTILNKDFLKILSLFIMHKKKTQWGDVYREIYSILYDKTSIFPTITKVKNWGYDGSGVNCVKGYEGIFLTQEMDLNLEFSFTSIHQYYDKILMKRIKHFKKPSLRDYLRLLYYGSIFICSELKSKIKSLK